jgi:peptidoglycan/LPS O-acetylase OafA/YrhL
MAKRITELDGLRGLAALMVVTAHYFGETAHGLRVLTFGWIGVDIFFVLSGFLIGGIILDHHAKPEFFKTFYLRRCARIIPVYSIVCLLVLIAAALTAGHVWSDHPYGAGIYAVFGTNIAIPFWGGGGEWLKPTWTLGVEEQFYLVMPLVILATPRRFLPLLLIALMAGSLALRQVLSVVNPRATLMLLPSRCDLLLSGVGIALLHRRFDLREHLMLLRLLSLACAVGVLALVLISQAWIATWGQSLFAIGIAAFLGAVVNGAPEGRRYNAPVLRWFGQISLAFYLVHQPIAGLLHGAILGSVPDVETISQILVSLLALGVSIAAAALSWHWLEAPILRRAHSFRFEDPDLARASTLS